MADDSEVTAEVRRRVTATVARVMHDLGDHELADTLRQQGTLKPSGAATITYRPSSRRRTAELRVSFAVPVDDLTPSTDQPGPGVAFHDAQGRHEGDHAGDLRTALEALLGAARPPLADPASTAQRMLSAVPELEPANALGPFYDTAGLVRWLGLTRQAVHARAKSGALLACPTEDGRLVFPSWQFTPDGAALPCLREILAALRRGSGDPWMHATWLMAPRDALGGRTPASWLGEGREPVLVLDEAEQDATRWAA